MYLVVVCESVSSSMCASCCMMGGGGGNEQSSGFKFIFLEIIVKIFGFQTVCPALAIHIALESEDSLEAEFLFSQGTSVFLLRFSTGWREPAHINMDYFL